MVKKVVCYDDRCFSITVEDGSKVEMTVKGTCPIDVREKLDSLGLALTKPESEFKITYKPMEKEIKAKK